MSDILIPQRSKRAETTRRKILDAAVVEFTANGLAGARVDEIAARAGVGRLLLTHIPPWTSRADVIDEATSEFDGPVHAVVAGEAIDVRATP